MKRRSPDDPLLDREQAAAYLGIKVWLLDRLRRSGEIKSAALGANGRCVRILRSELDGYLERLEYTA